jgi:hypothetical protein
VLPDTGLRSIDRGKAGGHDGLRHQDVLAAGQSEILGITGPGLSFTQPRNSGQQRNTGKAHTGCVCLLRAPDKEGIRAYVLCLRASAKRAAPVQYLAWRIRRRTRAFPMGRLGAAIDAACATFASTTFASTTFCKTALTDVCFTLTAQPLRAGD